MIMIQELGKFLNGLELGNKKIMENFKYLSIYWKKIKKLQKDKLEKKTRKSIVKACRISS